MRRSLARLLLLLASSCCGIVLIEFSWSLLPKVPAEPDPGGYKLLGGAPGSVYENVGRFYLYRPQTVVRVASYYNGVHDLVKEFEYERHTNNLGLVQKSDVHAGTPSVLILGDSFTEGMGAEPWFEQVVPFFVERNLQPINGGLMGTGFRQWILLHEHLTAQNIVVKKLIVVFISDDYGRNVWNFTKHQLDCFASYLNCKGDEEFYGMPPDSERPAFLRKLRSITDARVARHRLLPATTLAYGEARRLAIDTLWWLRARWRPPTEAVVD
ncbi:MAG: hypothetical protein Q8N52_03760, partial [Acidobacteriota bacterium]|nr:hypothetical protein [Acidobacteriota bacterium]